MIQHPLLVMQLCLIALFFIPVDNAQLELARNWLIVGAGVLLSIEFVFSRGREAAQ